MKRLAMRSTGSFFLLFLPAILGALALEGLLDPVQGLLDQFLSAIPQIINGNHYLCHWLANCQDCSRHCHQFAGGFWHWTD